VRYVNGSSTGGLNPVWNLPVIAGHESATHLVPRKLGRFGDSYCTRAVNGNIVHPSNCWHVIGPLRRGSDSASEAKRQLARAIVPKLEPSLRGFVIGAKWTRAEYQDPHQGYQKGAQDLSEYRWGATQGWWHFG
jgi:hypothetical protein